jgi:SOS-response transcriptional repressor LexA
MLKISIDILFANFEIGLGVKFTLKKRERQKKKIYIVSTNSRYNKIMCTAKVLNIFKLCTWIMFITVQINNNPVLH